MNRMSHFKIYCCFIAILVTSILEGAAQVRGVVVNQDAEPIDGIAVVALQVADSTYIGGTITDHSGEFAISSANLPSQVILRFEGIGYKRTDMLTQSADRIKAVLEESEISLGEVTVTPPSLQVSPGKFTFYPGDIAANTNNGFSLLEYVPLVRVDKNNDAISVIGKKNTLLLINGKEPPGSDYAVAKRLQAADPSRIKRIEIVMQPPLGRENYESIVNIIMTPQKGNVMTADAMLHLMNDDHLSSRQQVFYYGEYDRWQFAASLHANEKNNKTELQSAYRTFATSEDNTRIEVTSESRTSEYTTKSNWFSCSLGASLDLLHGNSIGINFTGNLKNRNDDNSTTTLYAPSGINQLSLQKVHSPYKPWGNVSVNYDHDLDSLGSSLWVKASFHFENEEESNTYNPGSDLKAIHTPSTKRSYQLRGSWNKVLSDRFSFMIATKSYHDRQRYRMFESSDNNLSDRMSVTDDFRYLQTQIDLSASADWNISDLIGIRAGATGRWYERDMNQYIQQLHHRFSDFYILPNASLSLSFNPRHMLTVSYGMELAQPLYYFVNPLATWGTPTQYYSGNPDLNPETDHNLSFTYILLQKIVLGGLASFKSDIATIGRLPEPGGIIHSTPVEIGKATETNLYVAYQDAFLKYRCTLYAKLDWSYRRYSDYNLPATYGIGVEKHSQWNLLVSNGWYLGRSRDWNLSADLTCESPIHQPFYDRGWKTDINFQVSKSFSWGGALSFTAMNILNSRPKSWYDCDAYSQWVKNIGSTRIFMLRFDITLGKQFDKRDISGTSGMGGN